MARSGFFATRLKQWKPPRFNQSSSERVVLVAETVAEKAANLLESARRLYREAVRELEPGTGRAVR